MSTAPAELGPREFNFTDDDFRALARLARAEFGLSLSESKKPLVYSRLARRLRARNIARFQDYMDLLGKSDEAEERLELISALTTNVTSFFREKHHFGTLRSQLAPALGNQSRVRIWSAGCSSGQEPFSIAMTLLDVLPDSARTDVRILATDIDLLRHLNNGRYLSLFDLGRWLSMPPCRSIQVVRMLPLEVRCGAIARLLCHVLFLPRGSWDH